MLDNDTEELKQRPNILTDIDLSCLMSPNWLNDNVINTYLELLRKKDESVFMFSTYFHTSFRDGGSIRLRIITEDITFFPIE